MPIQKPFNLQKWVAENRDKLKPPVGNKNLYPLGEDYIVMVVAGPNARKDYHYNETEELFYQLEGNITVRIQENGKPVDMDLGPGDMFLLPAKIPHSPIRQAGSIGLVVERVRKNIDAKDGLMWFCDNCNNRIYESYFPLSNIEKDFLAVFDAFYRSKELRTCNNCGTVMDAPDRYDN